jgi:hypothetical protein
LSIQLRAKAVRLKRILAYSIVAIFAGLLLVLLPLVTIIGVEAEGHGELSRVFSESQAAQRGSNSGQSEPSNSDVESLALSFIIAVFAFMFFRRRSPRKERISFGQLPY